MSEVIDQEKIEIVDNIYTVLETCRTSSANIHQARFMSRSQNIHARVARPKPHKHVRTLYFEYEGDPIELFWIMSPEQSHRMSGWYVTEAFELVNFSHVRLRDGWFPRAAQAFHVVERYELEQLNIQTARHVLSCLVYTLTPLTIADR